MMEFEKLAELIKSRRSVRKFQDKPVPEDLLLKALELATWAPNGGNFQPWRFLIVTNKELIRKMAESAQEQTKSVLPFTASAIFRMSSLFERWPMR